MAVPDKTKRSHNLFPKSGEIATHANSFDFAGLLTWLPNPDPILRELAQNQTAYENIMSDSHLAATIAQRKSGVKSMLWAVDRGKAKSRQAKAVVEMIENLDVYRIISDILEAPFWGMAPIEIIWQRPSESGLITPFEVMGKPPEWFLFDADNVLKMYTRESQVDGIDIPPKKFLLARHNASYKNPYGDMILSKCFWPVTFKKAGYKFWISHVEKYGTPTIVGKVPRAAQDDEYQKIADNLNLMIQDSVFILPEDSQVEVLDTKSAAGSQMYQDLLKFSNSEISKAVLGQTLTTEAGDKGTQALGTVHRQVSADLVLEDKRMVEQTFNTLIDFFMQINFGGSKDAPRFELYHEEDVDLTQAQRDKTLADTGQIKFTQQYWEKTYGFEKGDIEMPEPETEPEESESEKNFAESSFKDQTAVDELIDAFASTESLQDQDQFVEPVFELLGKSESFEEFKKGLIDIFPHIRPVEFEEKFRNASFVSQVWGNINGSEN
jgi:phage gp29-like protein